MISDYEVSFLHYIQKCAYIKKFALGNKSPMFQTTHNFTKEWLEKDSFKEQDEIFFYITEYIRSSLWSFGVIVKNNNQNMIV